jgi:hypothetical protein
VSDQEPQNLCSVCYKSKINKLYSGLLTEKQVCSLTCGLVRDRYLSLVFIFIYLSVILIFYQISHNLLYSLQTTIFFAFPMILTFVSFKLKGSKDLEKERRLESGPISRYLNDDSISGPEVIESS